MGYVRRRLIVLGLLAAILAGGGLPIVKDLPTVGHPLAVVHEKAAEAISWIRAHLHHANGAAGSAGSGVVVSRVVDGDTLHVRLADGRDVTVRTFGDDTPETHRPGRPVECGGPQATTHMRAIAPPGTHVRLAPEPGGDRVDQYGRLLRWVELPDHSTVEERQIRAGWATIYHYRGRQTSRDATLNRVAAAARRTHAGVYRLCGGSFHRL
ncbi:MAG: Micrococcal nuclease (thermonuclease)-like protein [Conexibacter sp.]|nr:Micrococcal nuclease (thermonuclease)-like protein [Conexibacter sp.]